MPREQWSVDIRANIAQALSKIKQLRAAIQTGTAGTKATFRPVVDPSGVKKGAQQVTRATKNMSRKTRGFIGSIQQDFARFGDIFARRIAFTFATAVERFVIGSLLAVPAAFGAAVAAGAEFEQALRRTATVAAGGFGDIEAAMEGLGATAREVGATTTFTATEVAAAMFELVSVGLSVEETNFAIASSADFAVAAQTDLGVATDLTTQIMKSFRLNADELEDVADKLVFAIDSTTLNVDRLQSALRFAAPAAGALGVSFDDMLTVVARFVDVTKQGGISGRAFRFMLQAMVDPSSEAQAKIKELGLTMQDLNPQSRRLSDIMRTLAASSITAADAATIFGRRAGPVVAQAIDSIRLSLAAGIDEMEEFGEGLTRAARMDLARKQAVEFMQTITSQFEIMRSKINELALQAFATIGPVAATVIKSFNQMLDLLIKISPELRIFLGLVGAQAAIAFGKFVTSGRAAAGAAALFGLNVRASTFALGGGLFKRMLSGIPILNRFTGSTSKAAKATARLIPFTKSASKSSGILAKIVKALGNAFRVALRTGRLVAWISFFVAVARRSRAVGLALDFLQEKIEEWGISWSSVVDFAKMSWTIFVDVVDASLRIVADLFDKMIQSIATNTAIVLDSLSVTVGKLVEKMGEAGASFFLGVDSATALQKSLFDAARSADRMGAAVGGAGEETGDTAEAMGSLLEKLQTIPKSQADFELLQQAIRESMRQMEEQGRTTEEQVSFLSPAIQNLIAAADKLGLEIDDDLAPIVEIIAERMRIAGEEADEFARKLEKARSAVFGFTEAELEEGLNQIDLVLNEMEKSGERLSEQALMQVLNRLNELEENAVEAGIDLQEFSKRLVEARNRAVDMADITQVLSGEIFDFTDAVKEVPDALEDVDILGEMFDTPTLREIDEQFESILQKFQAFQTFRSFLPPGAIEDVRQDLAEFIDVALQADEASVKFGTLGIKISQAAKALGLFPKEGETTLEFAKRVAEAWGDSAQESKDSWSDFYKGIREGAGRAFADVLVKGQSFAQAFSTMFRSVLVKLSSSISESFSNAFSGAFSGGEGFFSSLKSGFTEGFGSLDFGKLGESLLSGLISGGITAAISMAFEGLKSLIGSLFKGRVEARTERVINQFSALGSVSEDTAKSVAELSEELEKQHNRELPTVAAGLIKLGDILRDTGINDSQAFLFATEKTREVVERFTQGILTEAEAVESLNDVIPQLIDNMDKMDAAGVRSFRSVVEATREAGLEVEALTDFIDSQMSSLSSGLEMILGTNKSLFDELEEKIKAHDEIVAKAREENRALTEEENAQLDKLQSQIRELRNEAALTEDQFNRMGRLALAAFNEMRANGATLIETLQTLGPTLDELARRQELMGFAGNEALNELLKMRQLISQNKELVQGVEGIIQVMDALKNTGLLTEESFNDLVAEAADLKSELTEAGLGGERALRIMAPLLERIRDNAAEFGFEVDENTQKMIDQAEAAGLISEDTASATDIMEKGFNTVARAINRLIETMGGVPIELENIKDEAKKQIGEDTAGIFMDTGMVIKNEFIDSAIQAGESFDIIRKNAGIAFTDILNMAHTTAAGAIQEFGVLENELVGDSVFPDIAIGAEFSMKRVEEAARTAVDGMTLKFKGFKGTIPQIPGLGPQDIDFLGLGPQDINFFADHVDPNSNVSVMDQIVQFLRQQEARREARPEQSAADLLDGQTLEATIEVRGTGIESQLNREAAKRLNRAEAQVRFTRRG